MRFLPILLLTIGLASVAPSLAQDAPAGGAPQLDSMLPFAAASGEVAPDSLEPWTYFPLVVGNVWEYAHSIDQRLTRIELLRDSVVADTVYVVLQHEVYLPDRTGVERSETLFRYDTTMHAILPLGSTGGYLSVLIPCEFAPEDLNQVLCHEGWGEASYTESSYTLGDTTWTDPYSYATEVYFGGQLYIRGLGEVLGVNKWVGWYHLIYARVGGREYGESLFPVDAEPYQPGTPGLSRLEVWPNPFRERIAVVFVVHEPAPVELVVYDLLGRAVERRDLGVLPSGEHSIQVETHALPAGAYVLRTVIGGRSLTSAVVTRLR